MKSKFTRLLNNSFIDFANLFFPKECLSCGDVLIRNEDYLCLNCLIHLPRTNFHLEPENKVAQIFWGRVLVENATSFFYFNKGSNYQQLLHDLKYKGNYELGVFLGSLMANEIASSGFFNSIDVVVPVPLHPQKLKKRGYNQSMAIAEGISKATKINVSTENLKRTKFSDTQTRKGRYDRWENVSEIFAIEDSLQFKSKHILLVDDVITTGATIEACIQKIQQTPQVKVSVATLAYAE